MQQKTQKFIKIEPSVLSCDFAHLADEVKKAESCGVDAIHIDIMDGHFVPNLSMGPAIVAAINRVTDLPLDVHLMIYNPFDYVERFVEAGADILTIHFEASEDTSEVLSYIRRCNIKAGLAFCPETSASMMTNYFDKCDQLLIMTVSPGFGGQAFQEEMLEKIRFARAAVDKRNIRQGGVIPQSGEKLPPFDIQVDGGITPETASLCKEAGANVFVAGNSLYGAPDFKQAFEKLKAALA